MTKGVHQGCPVSPQLFNLYTEDIFREINSEDQNDYYEEVKIGRMAITDLRYADDAALLSRSAKGLNNIIQKNKAVSKQYGVRTNDKKTTVMETYKTEARLNIQVYCKDLQEVTKFEYLGS